MAKTNIQETETKVKSKSKKSKVKDETLEPKVEPLDNVKVVENNVKVDVEIDCRNRACEIDCRSYHHSDVVNGYIRRKRSI